MEGKGLVEVVMSMWILARNLLRIVVWQKLDQSDQFCHTTAL